MTAVALLYKEARLFVTPTYFLTGALTLFNLIPNYPMVIGAAYFMLAVFIAFSESVTNRDHEFTIGLPVSRKHLVRARCASVVVLELTHLAVLAVVAFFSALITPEGNALGMDGNYAFFGMVLVSTGLFNLVFLPGCFRAGGRAAWPGVLAAFMFFGSYGIFELSVRLIPGASDTLDTLDRTDVGAQLLVLVLGLAFYLGLTVVSYRVSVSWFNRVDL